MPEPKLTYGLNPLTKHLIHIKDAENGLACGCVCPKCGAHLQSVQGNIKEHHFRHYNAIECEGARMTALHLLAQEVFAEQKEICLPNYEIPSEKTRKPGKKQFESVILEQSKELDRRKFIPDCVATKNNKDLWVEFLVTHKVDDQKKKHIKDNGIYCIEVDLNCLLDTDYTQNTVYQFLVNKEDHRKWICCPTWDKHREEVLAKIKQEEEDRAKKEAEEKARQEKEEKLKQEREKEEALGLINHWMKTGDEESTKELLKRLKQDVICPKQVNYYNLLMQDMSFLDFLEKAPNTFYAFRVLSKLLKDCVVSQRYDLSIGGFEREWLDKLAIHDTNNSKFKIYLLLYILWYTRTTEGYIQDKNGDVHQRKKDYDCITEDLLKDWSKLKIFIDKILEAAHEDWERKIEYAAFNVFPEYYNNITEKAREKQKQEEKDAAFIKKQEAFYEELNIEAIEKRMRYWSGDELNRKILEYEQSLEQSDNDTRSNIKEILDMLCKFKDEQISKYTM